MPSSARVILVAAGVLGCAVAAVLLLPHDPAALRTAIATAGRAAPAAALLAWVLLTPALVSGTVLAAATGLAFGAATGSAVAALGAVLGGMAAFAVARAGARSAAEHLLGDRLRGLRSLLDRRGLAAVLAARLAPGVPTTVLHYAAGVSRVRTRDFVIALAVRGTLRTAPYALLGAGLGSRSPVWAAAAVASMAVGAALAALLGVRLRRRTPGALA